MWLIAVSLGNLAALVFSLAAMRCNPNWFNKAINSSKGFEISISLVQSTQGNKSYLNMMVYGEKKRGKTRKMLKARLEYYKDLLKDYLR